MWSTQREMNCSEVRGRQSLAGKILTHSSAEELETREETKVLGAGLSQG